MKFQELLDEQSSKPVTHGERPKPMMTPKTPSRKDQPPPAPVPRKPLTSRAEILEAVQLLSGDTVRITSINGGKKKKRLFGLSG